ncbi:MAG: hypothetical protein K2W99_03995 [Chthoniobacterales bacterium]|nr:hypothetical protein [Chthoniobacterales bacterium]
MAIEKISPFDFSAGILSLSLKEEKSATLPVEDAAPPLIGEAPVLSNLEKLFQGNQLEQLELESMELSLETLQVLSRETLKSLIEDTDELLLSAQGIAPVDDIECVQQRLREDQFNQELLAAFRMAILGG